MAGDRSELTYGAMFAGMGGLEMGAQAALGGRTAWHAEADPAASRVLAHRWPGVPNHGDVTAVNWADVEPVDVITGGTPCQDVSVAGRRAGMRAGTRSGLWASMCDAVDVIRPQLVIWENVRGVLSAAADSALESCPGCVGGGHGESALRAFGRVLGDLADIGYDAWWCGLRAADVGAPHNRFRVFVFATPAQNTDGSTGCERRDAGLGEVQGGRSRPDAGRRGRASTTDAYSVGREWGGGARDGRRGLEDLGRVAGDADSGHRGRRATPGLPGKTGSALRPSADTDCEGLRAYTPAVVRWEHVLGRPAPAPTELAPRGGRRLSPAFVEFMMGLPAGHVTSVPGVAHREQLGILGNGVVPQQAAEAARRWSAHVAAEREGARSGAA